MLTRFHSSSFCSCRTEYINELPPWKPIPVAAGFKACVCGRLLAGIAGSNAAGGMEVCLLKSQRIPTECGAFECDLETSKMKRPRSNRALEP